MHYDALIVGAGPAGLSAAIRLKQRALAQQTELSVAVLEKSAAIGGHILSGAVFDARVLKALFVDGSASQQRLAALLQTPVSAEDFLLLSKNTHYKIPQWILPACLKNTGHYVISLADLCRYLSAEAESLGVDIYPGFAAVEVLYNAAGAVAGVLTGEMGRRKNGSQGANYQAGTQLFAPYTLFAEGCRGQLARQLDERWHLSAACDAQHYALGIKEVWAIEPALHQAGRVLHTLGWPLSESASAGGGFVYHCADNRLALGLVSSLAYQNPYFSPYAEFQRFKTHPAIARFLRGGKRLAYGARSLSTGGLQSLPKLVFPGGALLGDAAGFLNAARLKGAHAAIKSGLLAADACFAALSERRSADELSAYPAAFAQSGLWAELQQTRNAKPWLEKNLYAGSLMFGLEQHVFGRHAPWTLHRAQPDHARLKKAADCAKIDYPKPDGVLSFDLNSSLYLANIAYAEDQPKHLKLKDPARAISVNLALYDAPETRYCPAQVYEIVYEISPEQPATRAARLQINAQNCIHCKACDIKDPSQNIVWTAPQGGDGPNYVAL